MKQTKILFIFAIFAGLLSLTPAKADYFVAYISEEKVGAWAGTWETRQFSYGAEYGFMHHYLVNVNTDPNISVRVRTYTDNNVVNGSWVDISTGNESQLTNNYSPYILWTLGGNYTLQFRNEFFSGEQYIHYADWVLRVAQ